MQALGVGEGVDEPDWAAFDFRCRLIFSLISSDTANAAPASWLASSAAHQPRLAGESRLES